MATACRTEGGSACATRTVDAPHQRRILAIPTNHSSTQRECSEVVSNSSMFDHRLPSIFNPSTGHMHIFNPSEGFGSALQRCEAAGRSDPKHDLDPWVPPAAGGFCLPEKSPGGEHPEIRLVLGRIWGDVFKNHEAWGDFYANLYSTN